MFQDIKPGFELYPNGQTDPWHKRKVQDWSCPWDVQLLLCYIQLYMYIHSIEPSQDPLWFLLTKSWLGVSKLSFCHPKPTLSNYIGFEETNPLCILHQDALIGGHDHIISDDMTWLSNVRSPGSSGWFSPFILVHSD